MTSREKVRNKEMSPLGTSNSPGRELRHCVGGGIYCDVAATFFRLLSGATTIDPASSNSPRRELLLQLYHAAVLAAAPGPALRRALDHATPTPGRPVWVVALGKASEPMAAAAVAVLGERGLAPAGGIIVAPDPAASPHSALSIVAGDHPEPGVRSLAAADELGAVLAGVPAGADVWVLLSGGTSSLIGAPVAGVSPADLTALYALLLRSGLDIAAMNQIRKRFTRWGAGRLAAACAGSHLHCFVISDVTGDDLAAIGSGPCVPDPGTARDVRALLERAAPAATLPPSILRLLDATDRGQIPETPKPGDPVFARMAIELIASNSLALEAAARRAAELGLAPEMIPTPLAGEAAAAGASVAATILNYGPAPEAQPHSRTRCVIWGGETTVTLGDDAGLGGRSQELALAAARLLAGADGRGAPTLLAAGTDGRDGPTDAAGAVVDGTTWSAIVRAGRDPARDLARHDAYPALDAAGALFRPGLTGTNVMDLVIGVCGRSA